MQPRYWGWREIFSTRLPTQRSVLYAWQALTACFLPWTLSVHMHPLHIQIALHEFGRNEHSILAPQCPARPGRRASSAFFSLEAGTISSVQDILGNAEDVSWDVAEAGEVVDIDQHQATLRRLYHINSIEIEAKDAPYAARQGEHFASDRDLTLDHAAV